MQEIYSKNVKTLASLVWTEASKIHRHPTDEHYSSRSRFVSWKY